MPLIAKPSSGAQLQQGKYRHVKFVGFFITSIKNWQKPVNLIIGRDDRI